MKAKPATPKAGEVAPAGDGKAGVGEAAADVVRPRLRRGVRLVFDRTRGLQVLLYPEGVLVPNPTATAILTLCDGDRTLVDITVALSKQYEGVRADQVRAVLDRLADRQVVEWT
jgi:pyrroloquinoline quinone biosynthesis protein D